jgi:hypothetical protein
MEPSSPSRTQRLPRLFAQRATADALDDRVEFFNLVLGTELTSEANADQVEFLCAPAGAVFYQAPKESFNSDGTPVSYIDIVCMRTYERSGPCAPRSDFH